MISWRKRPLAFIDVETTGKDPYGDRIVEIAVVRGHFADDGVRVESRDAWLIDPGFPIPEEATGVHGITTEMVQEQGLEFELAAVALHGKLRGAVPCAYNARFDRNCLAAEWLRHAGLIEIPEVVTGSHEPEWRNVPLPPWLHFNAQWLDPLPWSQAYCRYDRGGHKMDVAADRLGVLDKVSGDAHRATRDAELGLWVLWALSSRLFNSPDWICSDRKRVNFPATIPHDLAAALEVQEVFASDVRARYDAMFYVKRQREGELPKTEVDIGLELDPVLEGGA